MAEKATKQQLYIKEKHLQANADAYVYVKI